MLWVWKPPAGARGQRVLEQIRRLTLEPGVAGRIGLEGKLAVAGTTRRGGQQAAREPRATGCHAARPRATVPASGRDACITRCWSTASTILFANSRFLALLGMTAADVVGRPLERFRGPGICRVGAATICAAALAGEPAAERYEVELVGAHGEVTRVELSSTLIDSAGEPALLLTALEMLPERRAEPAPAAAARRWPRSTRWAKASSRSTPRGASTTSITRPRALLGQRFDQVIGKTFPDVASLVDESDRHSLGDPVRMALATGGPRLDGPARRAGAGATAPRSARWRSA